MKTNPRSSRRKLAAKRRRYHERKLAGLCVECAAGLPEDADNVRCVECRDVHLKSQLKYLKRLDVIESERNRWKRTRAGWRERGLCTRCGANRDRSGCVLCSECSDELKRIKCGVMTATAPAPHTRIPTLKAEIRAYQPLDEIAQSYRVRILTALYWLSVGGEWSETREIWQAAGLSDDYAGVERNSAQVALGRLVKLGLAERRTLRVRFTGFGGRFADYRITDAGRAEVKAYRNGDMPAKNGVMRRAA